MKKWLYANISSHEDCLAHCTVGINGQKKSAKQQQEWSGPQNNNHSLLLNQLYPVHFAGHGQVPERCRKISSF